ncbi:MAG: UDP-N-acetylmuramoyl-L-alanine--D-glutamate ligase [Planctomycetota bacterium]|nr:UDP-N-acetylmuramoyl-L-alanine--D-glutamate ligase [Planctomycetota bacterium]
MANKGGRGARAVVLGLGHFGGGEGAARFLAGRGWAVLVTDLKSADELARAIGRLSDLPIEYRLGGHRPEDLLGADLVVVNPAVPRTAPILGQARSAGVALSSSMNLFLALCPAPVAAVTGSTGKSTTAAMLAGMLAQTGRRVHLGGNIGVSLLPVLDQMRPEDMVVLEISCFQLEDAGCLPWSPSVAVVTNLTPNHLDRYGTPEAYAAAKRPIVGFQSRADVAVLNHRDPVLRGWARTEVRGSLLLFDPLAGRGPLVTGTNLRCGRIVWNNGAGEQVICAREHVRLPGEHNVANAMAACAAARWLGTEARQIREALCAFSGLEHRLEECGRFGGMKFYNDSDATTPESTIAALRSFERPMTLIAGGYSKGLDLGPMAAAIAARADALVTIGHCGPELAQLSREAGLRRGKAAAIREAGSLGEAVRAAIELSMPGSVILFSPGCASFDMFQNFAERGLVFKALVEEEGQRE